MDIDQIGKVTSSYRVKESGGKDRCTLSFCGGPNDVDFLEGAHAGEKIIDKYTAMVEKNAAKPMYLDIVKILIEKNKSYNVTKL
ncbi:MAG: hypothetical protein ABIG84_01930 [archaeon]